MTCKILWLFGKTKPAGYWDPMMCYCLGGLPRIDYCRVFEVGLASLGNLVKLGFNKLLKSCGLR